MNGSPAQAPENGGGKSESRSIRFYPGPVVRPTEAEGVFLDFNYGVRLRVPKGNYRVRFTDLDAMCVLFDAQISDCIATSTKRYYVNFLVELWRDGVQILRHSFDCRGKNVCFRFPTGVLGDVLAWFPYAEEFRKQHGCRLFCLMSEEMAALFRPAYPDIEFLTPDEPVPDCYAAYYMGIFPGWDNGVHQPLDYRTVGLWRCIPPMLGLEEKPLRPKLTPSPQRPIREPYVCIAAQASTQQKYWNNPRGWPLTVEYLKRLGYRVLCIDKARANPHGGFENAMPDGAEDFTGDLPLQQRVDLLAHADFFVGLASGLSWLAWAAGTPVVMISGFSLPFTEFYTPYRVINYHVCTGCWNDSRIDLDLTDLLFCPRHGGTERAFECSRYITPEQVCRTIDRLMADYGLDPAAKGALKL